MFAPVYPRPAAAAAGLSPARRPSVDRRRRWWTSRCRRLGGPADDADAAASAVSILTTILLLIPLRPLLLLLIPYGTLQGHVTDNYFVIPVVKPKSNDDYAFSAETIVLLEYSCIRNAIIELPPSHRA